MATRKKASKLRVLVIDIGGTNIKLLATGQKIPTKIPSSRTLTPSELVRGVRKATAGWEYDVITIGYPGAIIEGKIVLEPVNLGRGWVRANFEKSFGHPVKLVNDAAMQAIGSYEGGRMLFLGLGTGMGTAAIFHGVVVPMEAAHLPYRRATFEDMAGIRGLKHFGKRRWRAIIADIVARFQAAFLVDYVVLGGGHVKFLKQLPPGCRLGSNANAFVGGFRLWQQPDKFILSGQRRSTRRAK